jgi:hypothetical protein
MRTVTFSNPEVAKAVNDKFVATWVNRQPGFHNCDTSAEKRIEKYDTECFATMNFVTYFLTPDLDVLHYFSGYYSPRFFLQQIEHVKELADAVLDDRRRFIPARLGVYAALHESQMRKRAEESRKIRSMTPPKSEMRDIGKLQQFIARRDSYAEGMKHLADVHKELSQRAVMDKKPMPVARILTSYKHGNPFTEGDTAPK